MTRAVVIALALAGWSQLARAQEEDTESAYVVDDEDYRPLSERIPAVTSPAFAKRNRLEIFPAVGLTFNDPFYNHIKLGGGLAFHVFEWLGVSLAGNYFLSLDAPIDVNGPGAGGEGPELNRPVYDARLEVLFTPFYGKVSLLAEAVVHFDMYVSLGGGVLGTSHSQPTGLGTIAIGQHYFLNDWLSIRLEVRDDIVSIDRYPAGNSGAALQNSLSGTLGVGFWVPTTFQREAL